MWATRTILTIRIICTPAPCPALVTIGLATGALLCGNAPAQSPTGPLRSALEAVMSELANAEP